VASLEITGRGDKPELTSPDSNGEPSVAVDA
jgi:hypothetical protein